MKRVYLLFATAGFAGMLAAQSPFTYTDMLLLDRVSGLAVSPNGSQALFNVRSTDMSKNKGVSALWLKDLTKPAEPEVRLPISEGGAVGAQWGPNGNHIYFLSARGEGKTMQVWRWDPRGENPEQITRLPLDVGSFRVAPGGEGLVVSLAVIPASGSDEIAGTVNTNNQRGLASGVVYDRLFVRHWDTWADGTRNHLFHVDIATGATTALTPGFDGDVPSKPFGDESDHVISPDGSTVYFSAREAGKTEPWSTNFDLYSVAITGGPITNLTTSNKAWDANPLVSPDGRTLAYKAMRRPGFEADRFEIQLRDLVTGQVRSLASTWDRSVAAMQWSTDGKSLLVTADDMGRHRLFRIDVKSGSVTPLSKDGHIDAFHATSTGFVFMKSAMNSPSQVYMAKPKAKMIDEGASVLTGVNATLKDKVFGAYEQFKFPGWNNETVHGYVVKPANYVEGKKYPVAFLIHGGPQGSFGDMWSFRWNAQTYAGAGYAVVMIDFHGSTGYGQAFCDAISEHWGDRPLEDLQKGWAHALKAYPFLDGDRAAALGASYGGYMVNWLAGRWKEPWKCLVSHCGVFDARSMGYSTEELWFTEWENGGSAFTHPEKYAMFDPALYAKDWSVPMLVIHGERDFRIPITQGISTFTALQERNVPSKFLMFPDENHWVLKPQNSMLWHKTVFDWLDAHLGQ